MMRMGGCLGRLATASIMLSAILFAGSGASVAAKADETARRTLAVLPFEIKDTSGEAIALDQREAMLAAITRLVREEIEDARLYNVVPGPIADEAVLEARLGTYLRSCNGCDSEIARGLGADHVLVGWIFKMSRLVLALHVRITDVPSGKVIYLRTFDFRGDTAEAWQRAGRYMVKALTAARRRAMQQVTSQ